MAKYNHIFGRWFSFILTGLCLSVLTSCIDDYGDCPLSGNEGPFHLSFTILTKNVPGSRATEAPFDQIGTSPENYLDVNDVRILVFDDSQKFITDVTPVASVMATDPTFTIYEVSAKLDDPYFVDKVNEGGDVNIDFYILVLANYSDWGITFPPMQKNVALSEFFAAASTMTVMPDTRKLLNAVNDASDRQLFPMSGLQRFSINGNNLLNTTESTPFDLSNDVDGKNINMLRSLSKIEIVDKINIEENAVFSEEDKTDPLRIEKVELDGYMTRGTLIPAVDQWIRGGRYETQQVIAPTESESATYRVPPLLNADNTFGPTGTLTDYNVSFVYDSYATAMRDDRCPVYSCFVFEYSTAWLTGTAQRPYLRISTQGGMVDNNVMESLLLPMRLATYSDDNPPINVPYLLRNHIYRFDIVAIHQDIMVNWTVCPMDQAAVGIIFN